jgi:hypothetical protein
MRCRTLAPLLLTLAFAVQPASAQQLSLTIRDGLVNLDASNASVRQILDAWSRVGGTLIVNGDRVTGSPVSLKLVNVPERQALEVILRSAAGYMAAPRSASATPGASMFDRIMVLPTSSAPQAAKGAPPAPPNPFFRGRANLPPEEEEEAVAAEPDANQPPVFSFPNQGQGGEPAGDPANAFGQTAQPTPFGQPMQPSPFGQPMQQTPFGQPAPPNQFGQPANAAPFGQPHAAPTSPFAPTPPPQQTNPFGQVTQPPPAFGQGQQPIMNPFAAAAAQAQQQQQQQTVPAPGTFTIIGSPTPGVVAQPQPPTPPGQRPPGQQR